jgi:hypothetical protein
LEGKYAKEKEHAQEVGLALKELNMLYEHVQSDLKKMKNSNETL